MTIRRILTEPDPILRQKSQPVEKVDDVIRKLTDDMLALYWLGWMQLIMKGC